MKIFYSKFEAYKYILELIQFNRPFTFEVELLHCDECHEEFYQYRIFVKD